ncbi:MAG TPA: protein kinase, partial [Chitinophagaceae bacterium]|nr:protein kinase [Chitinophagaceae bacterium]
MAPDELYILPEDVRIIPVKELAEQAKTKFEYNDDDFVLTHSNSRVTSKIIDASSADLLKVFREPRSLVHGVFKYSILNKLDPGETLDESYPFLTRIRSEGFLKLYNENFSEKKGELIKAGEDFRSYSVIERIMSMSDTEIYKIKKGNTFFAVKILKTENTNSASRLHENFRNEIDILEILDGCVSPRLIEAGDYDGNKFIIMEWCEGISSDSAIGKYRNLNDQDNFTKVFTIVHNILEAYQQLHKKGIIHSDIHPRNVLVAANGEVKIIDFGLARIDNSDRYTLRGGMGFFFEPEYAETVLKEEMPPKSSFAGEQYSIAALIYYLVTGKHYTEFSFEKETLFKQVLNDPPATFEKLDLTIDPEIQNILFKALSKKPGDRFASMEEFSNCIFKAVQRTIQSGLFFVPDLAYSFSSFCSNLKTKYGNNSKLIESGLMLSPISSVNYGAAGIAYMFYRMARIENDPELLCVADTWANRSLDYQDETRAFYSADIEITPQTVGTTSIYHTESGAQLVQSLISKTLGDYPGYHKAVSNFITNSSKPCENPDLTLGKSGTLIGSSILLENCLPGNTELIENLKSFGDNKMNEIWEK